MTKHNGQRTLPDWQLPDGVDRGLWDYLHSGEMVRGYDAQMAESPLAAADVRFCEAAFPRPGRLADLGCGTGRLCLHFAAKGFDCVGFDLSPEMLAAAQANWEGVRGAGSGAREMQNALVPGSSHTPVLSPLTPCRFVEANLTDLAGVPGGSFQYAACLFSTLGMVRGEDHRAAAVREAYRILEPGGRFVLHAHNRFFRGLGWRRVAGQAWKTATGSPDAGDITMSQAYAGAPLTLHHFTRRGVVRLLERAGFAVAEVSPVPGPAGGRYGWLVAADKP